MTIEHIKFLMDSNRKYVEQNSYYDCHAHGLHSIGIFSNRHIGLRLFLADQNHTLYRNDLTEQTLLSRSDVSPMSVGFHEHRRDIMLQHLQGVPLKNIEVERVTELGPGVVPMYEYHLPSAILRKKGLSPKKRSKFILIGNAKVTNLHRNGPFPSLSMDAHALHTVSVERLKCCIWAVHEASPSTDHRGVLYTNDHDLKKGYDDGMYRVPGGYESIVTALENIWQKAMKQPS